MDDLVAMMDFLYCGEANVLQENLDTFLALANELQLKGLTGDYNTSDDVNRSQSPEKTPQKEVWRGSSQCCKKRGSLELKEMLR